MIFGIEEGGERYSITTWGKTKKLCAWAARIGTDIHEAVMGGEILDAKHADDPYAQIARLRAALADCMQYVDVETLTVQTKDRHWRTVLEGGPWNPANCEVTR